MLLPGEVIALPSTPYTTFIAPTNSGVPYGPVEPLLDEKHPKPIHDDSILCNCWAYVKHAYYQDLPSEKTIQAGMSEAFGDIAVFYYPRQGLWHYAKVTDMGYGTFSIDEANYEGCERSQRDIHFNDPHLRGFYSL